MKWLIISGEGTQINIDDERVSGVNVTIDGTDYDISITKS